MTQDASPVVTRKKLIEVSLPLDAINKASMREKAIRHGHPSTMHLWWARRPLAAARAVIFAQLVDDPSAVPEDFPTEGDQERERQRLFDIIEELVSWESTTNEEVLERARAEIRRSWQRTCADNGPPPPRANGQYNPDVLPAFHDPFAGGGALPLEAQRLGLEAHASDLNPVAALICKAMVEIPPTFADKQPANPEARTKNRLVEKTWLGAEGLAEDVRHYGRWMRNEAEKRIGHLYPKVRVTELMAQDRPDLQGYIGRDLTVIAWLWARTVNSPNPHFGNIKVPLARTFVLSKKQGNEAYVNPAIEASGYRFTVKAGLAPESAKRGTSAGSRQAFRCLMSGDPVTYDHIRSEGQAGRLRERLMSLVLDGDPGRVYLHPIPDYEELAYSVDESWKPNLALPNNSRDFKTPNYGMVSFGDLFSDRQLVALNTFSDLVAKARDLIRTHSVDAGMPDDGIPVRHGGRGATAYAEAVATYLAFAVDRSADYWSTICTWHNSGEKLRNTFGRQAIPMSWDYAEANPFSESSGNWSGAVEWIAKSIETLPAKTPGIAQQLNATGLVHNAIGKPVVSTDPPYYDNISYADLSDFFYVWLRRSMRSTFPQLFSTINTPRVEELVAMAYRHGGQESADTFFLEGMTRALRQLVDQSHPTVPVTIYYAYKQSERAGWDVFLDAVVRAGFTITATWPIRTEHPNKIIGTNANVLTTSVLLVCRPRPLDAECTTWPEYDDMLRDELSIAIDHLRRSNIPPVDLVQASIGSGMAVFTRFSKVLNQDDTSLSVRDALRHIGTAVGEFLKRQAGDLDADTQWALTWFEDFGYEEGEFGTAENLSKPMITSVEGLTSAGIIESKPGTVRLLKPAELNPDWDPDTDSRLTVWEMTQHLIRLLKSGERAAAGLAAKLGSRAETARDLGYRLYLISERKGRTADALAFNGLVQSWPEIVRLAGELRKTGTQDEFDLGGD